MTESHIYRMLTCVGHCDKCDEKSARGIELIIRMADGGSVPIRFCKNCVTKWYRRFQEFEGVAKYKSGAIK